MKNFLEDLELWSEFLKDPEQKKIYNNLKTNKYNYGDKCRYVKSLQENFSEFKRQKTLEAKRALKEAEL